MKHASQAYPLDLTFRIVSDKRTVLLWLEPNIREKLSKSLLLLGGLSGHPIEPTTSRKTAGHRSRVIKRQ